MAFPPETSSRSSSTTGTTNGTGDGHAGAPWPEELVVNPLRDRLTVHYEDGTRHQMSAEHLRVHTPSAERTGHGARRVLGGMKGVRITAIRPVGQYAVRIVFSDGHDTGLYTFAMLHDLGARREALWAAYETDLAATRLSRERPGSAPAPG